MRIVLFYNPIIYFQYILLWCMTVVKEREGVCICVALYHVRVVKQAHMCVCRCMHVNVFIKLLIL